MDAVSFNQFMHEATSPLSQKVDEVGVLFAAFSHHEGLVLWTVFASAAFAQQWLQHQEVFAAFVCSKLGTHAINC